jgi:hypothetical protein
VKNRVQHGKTECRSPRNREGLFLFKHSLPIAPFNYLQNRPEKSWRGVKRSRLQQRTEAGQQPTQTDYRSRALVQTPHMHLPCPLSTRSALSRVDMRSRFSQDPLPSHHPRITNKRDVLSPTIVSHRPTLVVMVNIKSVLV